MAGCTVEFENGELVSFDFLEDDSVTFDLFKFELFVSSTQSEMNDINDFLYKFELYYENGHWKIR